MTKLDLRPILGEGDALIIVPPYAELTKPCLAAHLLQACAREAGIRVSVLYANYLWAPVVGEAFYVQVAFGKGHESLGERIFSAAAYGGPLLGRDAPSFRDRLAESGAGGAWPALERLASLATGWAEEVGDAVADCGFGVVGCTSTFEQTSASVSLLNRVKARRPSCLTIIGGANCEQEMAEGIHSLRAAIDVVFSGESERTFVGFMQDVLGGRPPSSSIVRGAPFEHLDLLPRLRFEEFFDQRKRFFPGCTLEDGDTWLIAEGSRGCWWGEKHHCTFCGCNARGMAFREKSPDHLIDELAEMIARYRNRRVVLADRIMPHSYLRTVIPRLPDELPGVDLCWEQKSNLTLENLLALKRAGIILIQPGIEAFGSSLLHRMRKGVSGAQNVALLRYARAAAMLVSWNLLYGLPGDAPEDYAETLALLPLVHHLHPPHGATVIGLNRFSPYVDDPATYGITNLRPGEAYSMVFPEHADASKLAYHLEGDYLTALDADPGLEGELKRLVGAWREAWAPEEPGGRPRVPPTLSVRRLSEQVWQVIDTRGLDGGVPQRLVTREEAAACLVTRAYEPSPLLDWAIRHRLAAVLDGTYVPLATASPEVILQFEAEHRAALAARPTPVSLPLTWGASSPGPAGRPAPNEVDR